MWQVCGHWGLSIWFTKNVQVKKCSLQSFAFLPYLSLKKDLFVYLFVWLRWVFVLRGLSSSSRRELPSSYVLGLTRCRASSCCRACAWAFGLSSCCSWALEHRLSSEAHGLSCPAACGIFLGQGPNPRHGPWQGLLYHWATMEAPFQPFLKFPSCLHFQVIFVAASFSSPIHRFRTEFIYTGIYQAPVICKELPLLLMKMATS